MVVLDVLNAVWTFFATYVLQKAPYMVGFFDITWLLSDGQEVV